MQASYSAASGAVYLSAPEPCHGGETAWMIDPIIGQMRPAQKKAQDLGLTMPCSSSTFRYAF